MDVDTHEKELHLTPEGIPGVACPDCGITFVNRFLQCMSVLDVDESDRAAVAQREMELLGLNSLPSRAGPPQASQDEWQKWEDQLQTKNWGADEPSKWRKAESNGTGRSYGGWGPKRKTPEQEDKDKALDKETQQLLQLMTRMTLRHEKELSRLRVDTSFVMFCDVGDHGCLQQLKATAENWQEQYAAQKVTTSLKVIMMLSLLKALRSKMEQVTIDQEITEKYKTLAWLSEGANALAPCWNYLEWNSTDKKEQVASVPPIKHQEVLAILDRMEQAVPQPGILTDFRNTKGMDGKPSEVVPFLISIGLRQAATAEVHAGLQKLSGCSCMKLVACRLRPDRGQRPQLAKQIEEAFKATTYCDWGGDGGISTGECLRLPAFAEPQGTAVRRHCMVKFLSLPHDVYADMLECHLLLSCCTALLRQQEAQPCEGLGMMARSDLFVYAKEELDQASYEAFVNYSIQLSERVGAKISAITPPPMSLPSQHHSQAEILAWQILTNGSGSVWEAVRLVASMLRFEPPRQRMMQSDTQAMSFHLGICARGGLVGVCKDTLTHRNVCRLLCFYVQHLCTGHRFTSISINRNYLAPAHRDLQNGPEENLIVSLSLHDEGGLWVESPLGTVYHEIEGRLIRGEVASLQSHALLFSANKCWHAGLPWKTYDRYTLVAYTVRNWAHLREPARNLLTELGFLLPDVPAEHAGLGATPSILPPVLLSAEAHP
ncbi:unnamed protein product [Symbiodinium necroappetens]|uniref:Uncharacterized protein n=1 Tax=Symbiodinium necroappetens TaxID=1628268 RepID=A0A813AQD7_9DINO|nr:unnamed protein product [Symbiodinium necroappetens]